jgi:hypothetical protein
MTRETINWIFNLTRKDLEFSKLNVEDYNFDYNDYLSDFKNFIIKDSDFHFYITSLEEYDKVKQWALNFRRRNYIYCNIDDETDIISIVLFKKEYFNLIKLFIKTNLFEKTNPPFDWKN